MKDTNFNDYRNNQKHNSKHDTGKIPISQSEREIIENRNQKRYEEIIRNQRSREHSAYDYSQNATQSNKAEQNNAQRKKGCGCSTIILSLLIVFTILCGSALGYIYSICAKTQYVPTEKNFSLNYENLQNNVYNILLIGTDKEENGASRSDTMMLVSINNDQQQIKLTSFMRDLWVDIPGYEKSRLNSAYTKGGASLLMETISENFDIHIDNYVLVDFEMFKKLIDGVGGVTVEITDKEADFINRTTHAKVQPGINTLNGDYALIYCRIRKLDSDFMRTQRQRKVIAALVEKVKSQNLFISIKAASDTLPLITTDISALNMTFKLFSAISKLQYTTDQIRIPADGTYSNKTINGQAVLVPDLEENKKLIQDFIY